MSLLTIKRGVWGILQGKKGKNYVLSAWKIVQKYVIAKKHVFHYVPEGKFPVEKYVNPRTSRQLADFPVNLQTFERLADFPANPRTSRQSLNKVVKNSRPK